MDYDFDLFVIGAGSGGVRAARMAAAKGIKVAIAEEKALGGTCVNVGCVPKKLLVYASHFSEDFEDAAGFGWHVGDTSHSWSTLIQNKNKEIHRLNGIYQNLLENAGVRIFRGRARLTGAHSISIGSEIVTAERILITVGGTPYIPDFTGKEHVITSDQVFYLEDRPQRIALVGGGYIAVEFAGIFNGLGSETHIIYRGDKLLKHFDHGICHFASSEMQKKGIHIHYNTEIEKIEQMQDGLLCSFNNGHSLLVDQVMYATGRKALSSDLGLENTRAQTRDNAFICVDERFQTDEPSIFALGDVIGTPELTPVAIEQAMVFVDQQFGENRKSISYDAIPSAIFSQPNIAVVGLSEEVVLEKGLHADVYISEFRHLKHTLSGNAERVMMKIIVCKVSRRVLGMHMVGPDAGEIIQGFAVAVKAGLTKEQVDDVIGIHPTAAEEFVTLREASYSIPELLAGN